MAQPTGRIVLGKEEAQAVAERYAAMEAKLQALRQRNKELARTVQEQQDQVEVERRRQIDAHKLRCKSFLT